MATVPPKRQAPKPNKSAIQWLLDSDPSVRWQVMRDLTGAPAEEVAAERARVATEGWGAPLLALQGADGSWGGAAWNRGWELYHARPDAAAGLRSRSRERPGAPRMKLVQVKGGLLWKSGNYSSSS